MTELVEEVKAAIKAGLDGWIGISDLPGASSDIAAQLLPILARQRNEGIEAAARMAELLYDNSKTLHRSTQRKVAIAIRALKEPE